MRRWMLAASAGCWLFCSATTSAMEGEVHLGSGRLLGNGPDFVAAGAGMYDLFQEGEVSARTKGHSGLGVLEYRFGRKLGFAGPVLGILGNTDGAVYGYGGFYVDLAWRAWRLSPILAAGGYYQAQSKDLGGAFQFLLGGTLAYQFEDGGRLGLSLTHISNDDIHDANPGVEMAFLGFAMPLPTSFH